jgi:hypothetical protein
MLGTRSAPRPTSNTRLPPAAFAANVGHADAVPVSHAGRADHPREPCSIEREQGKRGHSTFVPSSLAALPHEVTRAAPVLEPVWLCRKRSGRISPLSQYGRSLHRAPRSILRRQTGPRNPVARGAAGSRPAGPHSDWPGPSPRPALRPLVMGGQVLGMTSCGQWCIQVHVTVDRGRGDCWNLGRLKRQRNGKP